MFSGKYKTNLEGKFQEVFTYYSKKDLVYPPVTDRQKIDIIIETAMHQLYAAGFCHFYEDETLVEEFQSVLKTYEIEYEQRNFEEEHKKIEIILCVNEEDDHEQKA